MNFADTNWLIALYTNPPEKQKGSRQNIAANFMRRNDGRLALSHPVLIETHNILCRLSGKPNPDEWEELQADFNGKIYVDPMNWSLMRAEADRLFARYAWKEKIGTLDTLIVASAKLAGATRFLSFDATAAALAFAENIPVFPVLENEGKRILKKLTA